MRKYGVGGWEEICGTGSKKFCMLSKNMFEGGIMTLEIRGYGIAVFPKEKLTQYALNPAKDKHKAEAFYSTLGYQIQDAEVVRLISIYVTR
ncbi:hypothetical protein Selsp_0438 [Selenomonas sputigena ATCC 35185]|uniref:Uncharacterized protein n=2 Tax=Selenomonas sputigena (strain ATCC 35185 / DSM 20758 / CCUG 44933 / VPI D19B-28) TaxID=546271 RepID=F4EYK3_SELS3|nr:hypothetical protein Selsp_0438 [Selenomonas sputigena ATCC 35185]